ncbi:MAG: methyltransferase FkbM [Nitratireductor sp.]|nr:methyltransferase FkbM [Nitratireductor sp.]
MTFTSYAQNFEDVILMRALADVEQGFYIDVGAQHPSHDSVSLAFYERGWRGIHIEPNPVFAEKLRIARPDEEVISAAISTQANELKFFSIWEGETPTGLSTGDWDVARQHLDHGFSIREQVVPSIPLSAVLDNCCNRNIHWLKIDIEGMEEDAIESWIPSKERPWIVVVESTIPGTAQTNYEDWEPKLLGLGYEFVYSDGLNRFYVRSDLETIKKRFGPGPNVFDRFVISENSLFSPVSTSISDLKSQLSLLGQELDAEKQVRNTAVNAAAVANKLVKELESGLKEAQAHIGDLERKVEAMRSSRSWKITMPIRFLHRLIYNTSKATCLSYKTRSLRPLAHHFANAALSATRRSPRLKKFLKLTLRIAPTLGQRVYGFAQRHPPNPAAYYSNTATSQTLLIRSVRRLDPLRQARVNQVYERMQ